MSSLECQLLGMPVMCLACNRPLACLMRLPEGPIYMCGLLDM